MPAARRTSESATALSSPIRRASRGASGAKAPKHRTGTVVSRPPSAADRPVSARSWPSRGETVTTAGRWLSATATIAATSSAVAARERAELPPIRPFIADHSTTAAPRPPESHRRASDRVREVTVVPSRSRMSILGTRVVRTEDPLFLTRGAVYTDDLADDRLTGALHATFVHSQVAHGRILSIDASQALKAPGVAAVVTAEGLTALTPIPAGPPMVNQAMTRPWLAGDTVRYVGEPIAVVLTEERYQGEDAAELVAVDIDPLPAVIGTAAAASDEVLLFPEAGTNVMASFGEPAPADFFDGCEVVVTQSMVNQRVAPVPLESRAAAAAWGEDGRATVWCTNQGAQQARGQFGDWLKMDPDLIRLITPDVGGGFGAKIGADP